MGHLLTAACIHHRATGKDNFLNVARNWPTTSTGLRAAAQGAGAFLLQPLEHHGLRRAVPRDRRAQVPANWPASSSTCAAPRPGGTDQNQDACRCARRRRRWATPYRRLPLVRRGRRLRRDRRAGAAGRPGAASGTDVTERKMYVTGAVGPLHQASRAGVLARADRDVVHEAFGAPYQLPNRTAYNETCANIGNAMWNWRMLALTGEASTPTSWSGCSTTACSPASASTAGLLLHQRARRFGDDVPLLSNDSPARWPNTTARLAVHCFCCPPNVLRTIAEDAGLGLRRRAATRCGCTCTARARSTTRCPAAGA